MQVEAKFACGGIIGPVRNGAYVIPEGSTISDLLDASLAESLGSGSGQGSSSGSGPNRKSAKEMLIFLRNGKQAQPDMRLAEGDRVHILLKIFGG